MAIKIYGNPHSTCNQRVAVVLAEKNVSFEQVTLEFGNGDFTKPEHLKIQPFGRIPVLEDDGFSVYESRAIAKYIAKKYAGQGTKLIPDDGDFEAYALFEQAFSAEQSYFDPPTGGIGFEKLFKGMKGLGAADDEAVAKHLATLDATLAVYDSILAKQPYIGGQEITVADLSHLPYGRLARGLGATEVFNKHPNVKAWFEKLEARESWKMVPKVVIKAPVTCYWESSDSGELHKKFSNETLILEKLGEHRNIARYLGLLDPSKPARDLLFEEVGNGDLQQYLNNYGAITDIRQKLLWCENAAEGLSYCHKLGVRHCDLRPDNLLVDEDLNLRICDFGGSTCGDLDDVFSVNESTEVFGLGSIMYTIMTGHRPHGPSVFKSSESIVAYGAKFEDLLRHEIFPDTKDIVAGEIILDWWEKKLPCAKDVLSRL